MKPTRVRFVAYAFTLAGLAFSLASSTAPDAVTLLATAGSFGVTGMLFEQTRQIKEQQRSGDPR